MTDAELDAIIEAGTNLLSAEQMYCRFATLGWDQFTDLVRAARELRELRRDATSRDGAL